MDRDGVVHLVSARWKDDAHSFYIHLGCVPQARSVRRSDLISCLLPVTCLGCLANEGS